MDRTGRVTTFHSNFPWVTDLIEIEQTEAIWKYCARCTVWEYIQRNNVTVTAACIINYISKLSLESFKDQKEGKNLTVIK